MKKNEAIEEVIEEKALSSASTDVERGNSLIAYAILRLADEIDRGGDNLSV